MNKKTIMFEIFIFACWRIKDSIIFHCYDFSSILQLQYLVTTHYINVKLR